MSAPEFNGDFEAASASTTAHDPSALIEGLLGVTPKYEEDYDLTKLLDQDRLQVRVEANVAPSFMVNRMAHQMAQSKFPPIIVTADDKLVDGNTRRRANRKRDNRFFPAWVIPISYTDAEEKLRERLVFLGRLLNNSNGQPLGHAEQHAMARGAIDLGMNNAQITGTVGISAAVVRNVRREMRGERAVQRVGIDPATLDSKALGAVGEFEGIHDEPLREIVTLAKDAKLGVREIKTVGVDVARAGSDETAVRIVKQVRESSAQRINDVASGAAGKPPAARLLRQRLGFITQRDPAVMVETNASEMRGHLEQVEQSIGILQEVARLQEAKAEDAGV